MDMRLTEQANPVTSAQASSTMTESSSSSSRFNQRSPPQPRKRNWLQKLKHSVGRKSRQGLLRWFNSQRRDLLDGLQNEDSDKVTNLVQLLSLPLEIADLESCLKLGVDGALREQCASKSPDCNDEVSFQMGQLDEDAEFLAKLLVGDDATLAYSRDAQDILEALQPHPTSSRYGRTVLSIKGGSKGPFGLGKTAQLTALVLMIAQILIGAQLLLRYRKRKNLHGSTDPASSDLIPSTSSTTKPSTTIQNRPARRRSAPMLAPENCEDVFNESIPSLSPGTVVQSMDTPNASKPAPVLVVDTGPMPSLKKHLSQNQDQKRQQQHDHDDDRTAETDSLSLSEGVPQKLEETNSNHSRSNHSQEKCGTRTSYVQKGNVLALLSFEGGTRDELDAGSNRTMRSTNQTENTTSTATTIAFNTTAKPSFLQDQFAMRMKKLKSDLFNVRKEQKTQLQDSAQHVQSRCQESNVQYSDLTERLEALTRSIQVKNSGAPLRGQIHVQLEQSAPSMSRPGSPRLRSSSPALVQAQAQVDANNEERAKLLNQVATLQQDLQAHQDKHAQDLQQKEVKLAELSTRIQFLSHELERRVLRAKQVETQLEQIKKQETNVCAEQTDLLAIQQQQSQLSQELSDIKRKFADKEAECQQLLQKLRQVPPLSSSNTLAQNEASAQEHRFLMKELEEQLEKQDKMNQRSFEMTQMLETKRADIILRTKNLEQKSRDIEVRRMKVQQMEAAAAQQQQVSSAASVASSSSRANASTEELEELLHELQSRYDLQAIECKKLNDLLSSKTKQLQEKEKSCHELTTRLEKLTAELQEKELKIEQLEQDVQDKQDLAAQNDAITSELQMQQDLQEKMNQTTLQMIRLLEEKDQSNAQLTHKLEAVTTELHNSKKGMDNSSNSRSSNSSSSNSSSSDSSC
jgi:hypothetical protein